MNLRKIQESNKQSKSLNKKLQHAEAISKGLSHYYLGKSKRKKDK